MADVFISYSKADRSLALKLAAMLEAEGWKTWWDTSLIPGDDFQRMSRPAQQTQSSACRRVARGCGDCATPRTLKHRVEKPSRKRAS